MLMPGLLGCGAGGGGGGATTATTVATRPAADVIAGRAEKVLASTSTTGDYAYNVITGPVLAGKLADPAQKDGIYIMDVRKAADYERGHIAGAAQVQLSRWASPDGIARLPRGKKIVVVSYTGNAAAQAAGGLRMLGYDAAVLKGGIAGWAQNEGQDETAKTFSVTSYPVGKTPSPEGFLPAPSKFAFDQPSAHDYPLLAGKAAVVAGGAPATGDYANNTITAALLSQILAHSAQRPYVLDIRQKSDFDKGHIEGAANIEFTAVAVPDNLAQLPRNRKIVVVSYTGAAAAQTVTVLRMLGYDAALLQYGMMSWNGAGKDDYLKYIHSANCPLTR